MLGGTVDVTLEKDISVFLVPIVSSEVPPGYSEVNNYLNKWSGTIALTYEYAVPEPTTVLLLASGLAGLAACRRQRKTS